jgi:hypothetical protein
MGEYLKEINHKWSDNNMCGSYKDGKGKNFRLLLLGSGNPNMSLKKKDVIALAKYFNLTQEDIRQ